MNKSDYDQQSTAQRIAESRKLDELKLGKFSKCEPLHLPEKETRRGWQIIVGVVLVLLAILGALIVFMIPPVSKMTWDQDGFGPSTGVANYQIVMVVCIGLMAVNCLIAGVLSLCKKRVPAIFWYLIIICVTAAVLCKSFQAFTEYEERQCYEKYPGIFPEDPSKGSGCPSVEDSLILLNLRSLAIYTVGVVVLFWVYLKTRHRIARKPKRG